MGYISHKKEIMHRIDEATDKALEMIGLIAEGYAKVAAPVDTGRLRNSISHATVKSPGQGSYTDNKGHSFSDAKVNGKVPDKRVVIFTNVEYAVIQETGSPPKAKHPHYLEHAVMNHKEEWQRIVNEVVGGCLR